MAKSRYSSAGCHRLNGPRLGAVEAYLQSMGLGRGKTEHAGPRDMTRKHGHWGFTDEAKAWASRARRRAEVVELEKERADAAHDRDE